MGKKMILGFVFLSLGILSTASAKVSTCKLDLGLVVDTTRSIKEFNVPKVKEVLQQIIQRLDISENGTHVSLETFAFESKLHNTFANSSFYNKASVLDLVSSSINQLFKPTRLDLALKTAKYQMFADENGKRPGVRKALILFTDGRSHPGSVDEDFFLEVVGLQSKGVRLIVVAVGPDSRRQKFRDVLERMAVGGKDELHFLDDFANSKEATNAITKSLCPNPCKNSKGMDVAFLVDRTQSLGQSNFYALKGFVLQIVDALNISRNATHVGIVLYAKHADVIATFADEKLYSNIAVHDLIDKIPADLSHPTRTDRGLMAVNNQLFTAEGGDRPDFPNVLIVLTDGKTHPKSQPFKEITPLLQEKAVRIVAVGVGEYQDFEGQLEEIGGENVYNVNNFDELPDLFEDILKETCSADGEFTDWSMWSDCDVTCGTGKQERSRTCTSPSPQGYGDACAGKRKEARVCKEGSCPAVSDSSDISEPEMLTEE